MLDTLKKYVNLEGIILLIVTFLLFYYSVYFQLIPVFIFKLNISNLSEQTSLLLSLFSNIVLAIILILIFKKQLKKEFKIFKNKFTENIDCGIKYWLVGLFIMMASNILIALLTPSTGASNEKAVQTMISTSPWIMIISAGILAPICEELVFRKSFKNAFTNKLLFTILSSLVFGALHVMDSKSIFEFLYIIPYGSLGFAFACMYSKTSTIFTSMSMHMFHNIVLILLSIAL